MIGWLGECRTPIGWRALVFLRRKRFQTLLRGGRWEGVGKVNREDSLWHTHARVYTHSKISLVRCSLCLISKESVNETCYSLFFMKRESLSRLQSFSFLAKILSNLLTCHLKWPRLQQQPHLLKFTIYNAKYVPASTYKRRILVTGSELYKEKRRSGMLYSYYWK